MAAAAILRPKLAAGAGDSYDDPQARRAEQARGRRLTEVEAADLRYLWQGYAADLGIRSLHGMIERQLLLRAAPRDVQRPVLEELERVGGRAPEGRIIRIVTIERWGTRREVKMAIEYLCRGGKRGPRVERIPVERPETPTTCEVRRVGRACSHPCVACEWTGFDLRMTERGEVRMRTALDHVPRTRAERWSAQDEAIQQSWRMMAVSETRSSPRDALEEPLSARKRAAVNRATSALARLSAFDARVIATVYGDYHATEEAEVDAVRRMVGGSRDKAVAAIERACEAYRTARQ